ncbi:MAG: SH3 domain-containing protein [Pseudomonadota bacterium]|nr:SH3 domain-containing protein [Pseudomonadota bacterium]
MRRIELVVQITVAALFVIGVIALVANWGSKPPTQSEMDRAAADWAAREVLKRDADLRATDLSIGIELAPKKWDFRGSVDISGGRDPIYGSVELTCPTAERRAECWRLARLVRNGLEVVTDRPAPVVGGAATPGESQAAPETSTAPVQAASPAPAAAPARSEPAAVPVTYWTVTGGGINGRAGPGTDFPVVARLEAGVKLERLEQSGAWSRYVVREDGASEGLELWIWDELVRRQN